MRVLELFAGLGGGGLGARRAQAEVVWAANHWPKAVHFYGLNHPGVRLSCEDVHRTDWTTVPDVDGAITTPCCQGHTRSRGKERPWHDASRSTAWAVTEMAQAIKPGFIIVENVHEFKTKWPLYPAWLQSLEALGYSFAEHLIDVADLGVPQNRLRFIGIATRSKAPFRLSVPRLPHSPVNPIIQWDQHNWSPIHKPGRAKATIDRINQARADGYGDRFVAPYYGSGSGKTGRSLERPIGTITTRARWAVVDQDRMRMLHSREAAVAQGFPTDYHLPKAQKLANHLIGNAVPPPLMEFVVRSLMEAA